MRITDLKCAILGNALVVRIPINPQQARRYLQPSDEAFFA